jgi:O-acetyl-ADP-ribose deacetylase (regulator of RNase III)
MSAGARVTRAPVVSTAPTKSPCTMTYKMIATVDLYSYLPSNCLSLSNPSPLHLLTMTLSNIGTFRLSSRINLFIARGSVLEFESKRDAAIVNAANEGCLGGGGVDGAISNAGGEALFQARLALPVVHGQFIRCPAGDAKLTGPGDFGEIKTNHVIHAVGPDYNDFSDEEYDKADALLKSAYMNTLQLAQAAELKEVSFSLLSAGLFRGERSLKQVLELAVESVYSWSQEQQDATSIESIIMCAFLRKEANALVEIATELGLASVVAEEDEVRCFAPTSKEEGGALKK